MTNEALANEIEREGIEGVLYKRRVALVELNERLVTALRANAAPQDCREGFYEKLWKDFCSLQRGDMIGIMEKVERYYRETSVPSPAAGHAEGGVDWAMVPKSALRWLFGEEGDFEPTEEQCARTLGPGKYWWRSQFRARIEAASSDSVVVPRELLERLLSYTGRVRSPDIAGHEPIFGDMEDVKGLLAAAPKGDKHG